MHSIKCGNCNTAHTSAAAVKACHTGNLLTCHWMVERYIGWVDEETGYGEGEMHIVDCGAEAIATERGWTCDDGHEHVTMQARHDEGWDYAECADEAQAMVMAGVQPFTMDGHLATSHRDFAPSYAMTGAR